MLSKRRRKLETELGENNLKNVFFPPESGIQKRPLKTFFIIADCETFKRQKSNLTL